MSSCRWSISLTLSLSNRFAVHTFVLLYNLEQFFWNNSSNSGKIFTLLKKIIRILAGAQHRTSCRRMFKQLEILSVPCQYIRSLMHFITNNKENFQTNSSIHNINIRNKHHLRRPNANLSCFQKRIHFVLASKFSTIYHPL